MSYINTSSISGFSVCRLLELCDFDAMREYEKDLDDLAYKLDDDDESEVEGGISRYQFITNFRSAMAACVNLAYDHADYDEVFADDYELDQAFDEIVADLGGYFLRFERNPLVEFVPAHAMSLRETSLLDRHVAHNDGDADSQLTQEFDTAEVRAEFEEKRRPLIDITDPRHPLNRALEEKTASPDVFSDDDASEGSYEQPDAAEIKAKPAEKQPAVWEMAQPRPITPPNALLSDSEDDDSLEVSDDEPSSAVTNQPASKKRKEMDEPFITIELIRIPNVVPIQYRTSVKFNPNAYEEDI